MRLVERVEHQKSMGGNVQIGLVLPENSSADSLFANMWLTLFTFERSASRFIETSEVTQLNMHPAVRHPITPLFRELLLASSRCAQQTEGLYNPFVLPAVQRTGYMRSATSSDSKAVHDVRSRRITAADKLEIGADWARIPYGTAIDMGGCGKGFIIDQLATMAREAECAGGWIEASGDIYAWGHDANGNNLRIAIQDQDNAQNEKYFITVPSEGCGVATSGTYTRPGVRQKNGSHHIIDPRSGEPAHTDLRLATVVAKTAILADVLASCAIIVGSKSASVYLQNHGASSWLLQYDKRVTQSSPILHGKHVYTATNKELQHA